MGTTAEFLKLRSGNTPNPGEWNKNYELALDLAKKHHKFIITCWSNGDVCGFCTAAEKCMMTDVFKDWMKTVDAYFVFQYSGDPDKGKTLYNWIFNGTKVSYYPGFRITIYDPKTGKISYDRAVEGNKLRNNQGGTNGAKKMIENLNAILAGKSSDVTPTPKSATKGYKIRLNEKLTVAQINKILDAIDNNKGYCPCQPKKSLSTKCHCRDFKRNKQIGEPCICNIYVKQGK